MTLDDIGGHASFDKKKILLHNADILEKFLKYQALNKKYIPKKMILKF